MDESYRVKTWGEGVRDAMAQLTFSERRVLSRAGRTPAEVRAVIEAVDEIKRDLQDLLNRGRA